MSESDEGEIEHPTKSTTSQPQEEFIEQKARPSRPEHAEEETNSPGGDRQAKE
jgi:hypothetical protein